MNLNFLKKLLLNFVEGAAKDGLVELIEKLEKKKPTLVHSFVNATAEMVPALKELAEETDTKVDDEVVKFLSDLLDELKDSEPPVVNETNDDEGTGGSGPGSDVPPANPDKP